MSIAICVCWRFKCNSKEKYRKKDKYPEESSGRMIGTSLSSKRIEASGMRVDEKTDDVEIKFSEGIGETDGDFSDEEQEGQIVIGKEFVRIETITADTPMDCGSV